MSEIEFVQGILGPYAAQTVLKDYAQIAIEVDLPVSRLPPPQFREFSRTLVGEWAKILRRQGHVAAGLGRGCVGGAESPRGGARVYRQADRRDPQIYDGTRQAALAAGIAIVSKEEASESVGYGKLPTATRFPKGRSGNPRGRSKNMRREIRFDAVLGQMVTTREDDRKRSVTSADAFLLQLTQKGLVGDSAASRASLEAIEAVRA